MNRESLIIRPSIPDGLVMRVTERERDRDRDRDRERETERETERDRERETERDRERETERYRERERDRDREIFKLSSTVQYRVRNYVISTHTIYTSCYCYTCSS